MKILQLYQDKNLYDPELNPSSQWVKREQLRLKKITPSSKSWKYLKKKSADFNAKNLGFHTFDNMILNNLTSQKDHKEPFRLETKTSFSRFGINLQKILQVFKDSNFKNRWC